MHKSCKEPGAPASSDVDAINAFDGVCLYDGLWVNRNAVQWMDRRMTVRRQVAFMVKLRSMLQQTRLLMATLTATKHRDCC